MIYVAKEENVKNYKLQIVDIYTIIVYKTRDT